MQATDITANQNHPTISRLAGFSIRESAVTPAAAAVNLRDSSVSGQILAVLELAANESATVNFDDILSVDSGVYVEQVAGTVTGVLYSR